MKQTHLTSALNVFESVLAANENSPWEHFEKRCGQDTELRTAVRVLYDADQAFVENSEKTVDERALHLRTEYAENLLANTNIVPAQDQSGSTIDGYELIEQIGAGGMGEIYRARNKEAGFDHDVALKLMRSVVLTEENQRLFESERSFLAQLKHPNIATLYAGGATEEGTPYFVLELVKGKNIDEYCDDQSLTIKQRLELFRKVCGAVQFAHSQLIIHRDIKPSNVLVDEYGLVKLLDFGIAKQLPTAQEDQTATVQTAFTPDYASPEQLLGSRISTTSDVYSLGVLLFKLLTGTPPHEVRTAGAVELVDIASRITAPRASKMVVAEKTKWAKTLSGDLDNILGKALEKSSANRYQSVQEFSEDISKYLLGLPISAQVNSWRYRTRKYVGRHLVGVSTAAAIAFTLIGITLFSIQQLNVAREERDRAARANLFLNEVLLSPVAGGVSHIKGGRNLTLMELINQLPAEIEDYFSDDPHQQLDLLLSVVLSQFHYDEHVLANETMQMAEKIATCCVAPPTESHVKMLHLRWVLGREEGLQDAADHLKQAMTMLDSLPTANNLLPMMTTEYGQHLFQIDELEEAELYMDRAIQMNQNPTDNDHKKVLTITLGNRSLLAMRNGALEEALHYINRSIAVYESTDNALTLEHAASLFNRSNINRSLGHYSEAAEDNERAIKEIDAIGGSVGLIDMLFAHHLALLNLRLGDSAQARHYLESADIPEAFDEYDFRKRITVLVRGELALAEGKFEDALEHFEFGLKIYEENSESDDQMSSLLNSGLSLTHFHLGDTTRAISFGSIATSSISQEMKDKIAIVSLIESRLKCVRENQPADTCLKQGITRRM